MIPQDELWSRRLQATVAHSASRTAVVDVSLDRGSLRYGELWSLGAKAAWQLARLGVGEGTVVAYQLPNWWEFAVLTLGLWRLNAIPCPILPDLGVREVERIVQVASVGYLIVPQSFRGRAWADMAARLRQTVGGLEILTIDHQSPRDGLELGCAAIRRPLALPTDWGAETGLAQLLFTSGTTGEPKGVLHTHGSLSRALARHQERFHLTADDTIFVPSPMAHQTGFLYGMLLAFYLGSKAVYLDRWDSMRAREAMGNHQVRFVQAGINI